MEQSPQQQIIERIKSTENVLVTVSNNPSVDQLAACIGLTLLLNKAGKHGTAVFSGEVPSTIEFLEPEETIQKNTDSLQDFIISLDKSKADRLRYKVEDDVVKIFITPYRTSIDEEDLEFSSGDFNVDVVIALGVAEQKDLDQAITAHGRILHDATVISVNNKADSTIGAINWSDSQASSLSEMVAVLTKELAPDQLDSQMATALLTGIVSETDRFRDENTTPKTMNISADLMSAGANQQLIVTKLEVDLDDEDVIGPEFDQRTMDEIAQETQTEDDGSLYIPHDEDLPPLENNQKPKEEEPEQVNESEIHIDDEGTVKKARELIEQEKAKEDKSFADNSGNAESSHIVLEPPMLGGTFTANSRPEDLEPSTDPLSMPKEEAPMLDHEDDTKNDDGPEVIHDSDTLQEIEKEVKSPHLNQSSADIDSARKAVENAEIQSDLNSDHHKPLESINAQPLDLDIQNRLDGSTASSTATSLPTPDIPEKLVPKDEPVQSTTQEEQPLPPPPVPPPMMPPATPPTH
jgi:hypothetical protein